MLQILVLVFIASILLQITFLSTSTSILASVPGSPVPKSAINQTFSNQSQIFISDCVSCQTNRDCWNSWMGKFSTCVIPRDGEKKCICNFGYINSPVHSKCTPLDCSIDKCAWFTYSICDKNTDLCICLPEYAVNLSTARCERVQYCTPEVDCPKPNRKCYDNGKCVCKYVNEMESDSNCTPYPGSNGERSLSPIILGTCVGVLGFICITACLVHLIQQKQILRNGRLIGSSGQNPYSQLNDEWFQMNTQEDADKVNSLTFSHLWILSDFTNLYKEECQWKWQLESEYFSPPEMPLQFSLVMWPKRICIENDEETTIGFEMCSWTVPTCLEGKLTLNEKRWIVDEEGRQLYGKEYAEWVMYANTYNGDSAFLPVKQLFYPENGYIHNGKLTILSEITLHSSTAIFPKEPSVNLSTCTHTTVPLSVTAFSHRFTLEHFKWMSDKRSMPFCIESADFAENQVDEPGEGVVGNLRIALWPNGSDGLGGDTVCLGVRNRNQDSVLVHFKLRILDIEEDEIREEKEVQVFYKVERTVRINAQAGQSYPISRRNLLELLNEQARDELTVDCRVQVLYPSTPISQSDSLSLRMPTTTFSSIDLGLFNFHAVNFTWPIEQFTNNAFSAITDSGPYLDSKLFSPSTDLRYRFQLRVYPTFGKNEETETKAKDEAEETSKEGEEAKSEQVMLKLRYLSQENETEETTVQWIVTLQDASENEWTKIEHIQVIYKDVNFDLQPLISRLQLNNFWRFLLPNNTLTLQIQLWVHEKRTQLPLELLNQPSGSSPSRNGFQIVNSQLQSVLIVSNSHNAADNIILGNGISTVSQAETPL